MATKKLQLLGNFGTGGDVQIDNSLTQSGQAADAQVTGEKINDLEIRVDNIDSLIGDEAVATQISNAIAENEEIYVGPEEPTNPNVDVWIDTDANADTAEEWRASLDVYSKAETDMAVSKRDRVVNLLDNSDFTNPVNQKGQTSYANGKNSYTIDRWSIAQWSSGNVSTTTVSIEQKAIRVSGGISETPNSCAIEQKIDATKLRGKTLTLAVKANNVSMNPDRGGLFVLADDTTFVLSNKLYANAISVQHFTVPDNVNILKVVIGQHASQGGNGTFDASLEWAALYEGVYTAETLPAYVPKGYAHELAECQRYYENSWYGGNKARQSQMQGFVGSTNIDTYVFFKQPKRIQPTITFYPYNNYGHWVYFKGQYVEAASETAVMRDGNIGFMARLAPNSNAPVTTHYSYAVDGHWEASADL